jgi:hypothetical protein
MSAFDPKRTLADFHVRPAFWFWSEPGVECLNLDAPTMTVDVVDICHDAACFGMAPIFSNVLMIVFHIFCAIGRSSW